MVKPKVEFQLAKQEVIFATEGSDFNNQRIRLTRYDSDTGEGWGPWWVSNEDAVCENDKIPDFFSKNYVECVIKAMHKADKMFGECMVECK